MTAGEKARTFQFTLKSAPSGGKPLAAGERLLVSLQYIDDDKDGFPPSALRWGGGLDGSRSTSEYNWLLLAGDNTKK